MRAPAGRKAPKKTCKDAVLTAVRTRGLSQTREYSGFTLSENHTRGMLVCSLSWFEELKLTHWRAVSSQSSSWTRRYANLDHKDAETPRRL